MGTILKVTAGGATHLIGSTAYGECTTAAATAAKTVNITGDGTATIPFTLLKGATVHIKFSEKNTASSATLNVNGTGAKPLVKYGTTRVGTTEKTSWSAGSIISFTYDGTSWVMNDHIDDTDTNTQEVKSSYATITAGETSVSTSGLAFGVYAYTARDTVTHEEVIVDYSTTTQTSGSVTVEIATWSIATAHTNNISIRYLYKA